MPCTTFASPWEGYSEINLTVFFPLYPVLIRLAMPLAGGNALLAALVLSNAACLLALVAFYKLLEFERFDDETSQRALMYCLFFPAGVFLLMPYTEPLFLLLAVLCMLAARQRRWGWAALAALAASLTRVQGAALAALLAAEALQQAGWSLRRAVPRIWVALAPLLGAGSFLLWRSWAGWPPMNEVLGEIWGRFPGPPWQGVLIATQQIISGRAARTDYVEYPITLLMLAAAVPVLRRLPLATASILGRCS
jgi:Gpi18-like mannosyltransferase